MTLINHLTSCIGAERMKNCRFSYLILRFAWVVLPLLIFIARIWDVSMETIYISKGIKVLALVIAFFEIVILAMGVVMDDLSNIANFHVFAFGFSIGTYVGHVIEEKLSIGKVILRVVTRGESNDKMQSENYGTR
jgi:uncharacterized protein YebE (UPF0316 family)